MAAPGAAPPASVSVRRKKQPQPAGEEEKKQACRKAIRPELSLMAAVYSDMKAAAM